MINTYRRENEIKFYRKKENMEQRRRMRAWKLPQQWAAASSGIAHVACEVQPKCGACPDCCTAPDKSPSLTPPGDNDPSCILRESKEDSPHNLTWDKVKTKHHFQSLDLILVQLKVKIKVTWPCGLGRP